MIFAESLLVQGYQGGAAAAQQLTKSIAEHLSNEDVHIFGRLSFWVSLYFNKEEVLELLTGNNICTQDQFEAFLAVRATRSHHMVLSKCCPLSPGFQPSFTPISSNRRWFREGRGRC